MRTSTALLSLTLACSLFVACSSQRSSADPSITRITITDRNGMTETVSSKDRLSRYSCTDFLRSQPYQKVTQLYSRDVEGNNRILLTTYHPNGQVKQYLEGKNNRALGAYREWHANGQQRVEAYVIGGTADLDPAAEQSWVFDGCCRAWNQEGQVLAEIPYCKGVQEGIAQHYHSNGQLWKRTPYQNNEIHGTQHIYLNNGELLQESNYSHGQRHGSSVRYWSPDHVAYEEHHENGRLIHATYFDRSGKEVSRIVDGNGFRAVFGRERLNELHEFQEGIANGAVKEFSSDETLKRIYHVKNGVQHGEETIFRQSRGGSQRQLAINWHEGCIQGEVKSWYKNGNVESLREMSDNHRHGISTAWYLDGSLMLIEEYNKDKLVRGEYHRCGESTPVSQVINGSGVATLFTPEGSLKRRVNYREGLPQE